MTIIENEVKQSKFRDPYQKAAVNLLFTASWLQSKHQEFFKPFGITPQQFNILRILRGQHPGKISGVEIKARMLDRSSDISRLLDRLIKKNLILKSQCPKDKRAADITITLEGLALLTQIDERFEETEKKNLALSEEDATLLSDLLDRSRGLDLS